MALLSRSGRTQQKASEQHDVQVDGLTVAKSKPPTRSTALSRPHSPPHDVAPRYSANQSHPDDGLPASKRRKLGTSHTQTTLDSFTTRRPPTKVTLAEPHGQLIESLNGVQSTLDLRADDLPTHTTPARFPPGRAAPTAVQPTKTSDKRTLRSQDEGPRLKSELAIYFPNYEDVILDAPQKEEFVTVDSAIYITDDSSNTDKGTFTGSAKKSRPSSSHQPNGPANGSALSPTPNRASTVKYSSSPRDSLRMIARTLPDKPEDPLDDEHFFKSHRRAERKEKQLRNIERERAMHEKVQLERILDGLLGHDWLKVLGLTGITDGEARKYEVKRDFFIGEVRALVEKFKLWKEQEKRQRVQREEAVAALREVDSTEPESDQSSVQPSSSELNASASRQLQMETAHALKKIPKLKLTLGKHAKGPSAPLPQLPISPPSPEIPITSFYDKKHLRDAALGKSRHGRNVSAFGHVIPELDEREFDLPGDFFNEDFLRANARERRRRKRESMNNNQSKTA